MQPEMVQAAAGDDPQLVDKNNTQPLHAGCSHSSSMGANGMDDPYSKSRSCVAKNRKVILIGAAIFTLAAVSALVAVVATRPWMAKDKQNEARQGPGIHNATINNGTNTNGTSSDSPDRFTQSSSIPISSYVQCNAYTPPLNKPFPYGQQPIRGVNLGGWLVLEPFITPSVFEPYISQGVTDEYSLTKLLGPEKARAYLRKHYSEWVTEDTFRHIRDLGLNHVRIPLGFWALGNLEDDEPYVSDLSLDFLLQGLKWAAMYGIRVMVELHAAPGSQNGWNHSGRGGKIGWLDGTPEGTKNGKRTLAYLKQLWMLLQGPGMEHVSPMFGILNEPAIFMLERDTTDKWYKEAFAELRATTGGAGKGPWGVLHDGFLGLTQWEGFMHGADRLALDVHQYLIFDHDLIRMSQKEQVNFSCDVWAPNMQRSTLKFGPTLVGEFSSATNDCATYLNGVGIGYRWDGTFLNENGVAEEAACQQAKRGATSTSCSCAEQNNVDSFTPEYRKFLTDFTQTQMDAFEQGMGWFYWNFKTENNALWSYFDGVNQGWIPKDANNRPGGCKALGHAITPLEASTLQ
ncbi:hypothetical protein BGZ99_001986 [Dissophora globulifera]|uniref:glucan 1,3-beta-glucosidase n=1 Tax=Dissophora globulifera TaxID=979702 RepID=A0A9P6RQY5_9FUNG|nr:hypothetical protein BGZ99_001986 [Dissophora globulifera]